MFGEKTESMVLQTGSVESFFHESLIDLKERRQSEVSDSSLAYLVNLLSRFLHADQLFEWEKEAGFGLPTLAFMYGKAMHSPDRNQRISVLRRLGDVALFVAGLFGPGLTRKLAGMNYYIDMGGGAYGMVYNNLEKHRSGTMDPDVFRELSEHFPELVELLDEFAQDTSLRTDRDLLTLYEHWLRNNNPATAARLAAQGVSLSSIQSSQRH
ncbi:MAG: hypothetical protein KTR18_10245 [Acidiferrobacterales bacterium]|nr:hypothetical protein [Acidiferrobacterales bacterium]